MAAEITSGRVVNRDDSRYDWIVSDGSLLMSSSEKLMLQSPFFDYRPIKEDWKMTLHFSPPEMDRRNPMYRPYEEVKICVASKYCYDEGGRRFDVGFINSSGQEILLGSGTTNDIGMCVIEASNFSPTLHILLTNCAGRLIVFCRFHR